MQRRRREATVFATTDSDLQPLLDYTALAQITGEGISTLRRRKTLGTGPRALRIGRHIRFTPGMLRSGWRAAQSLVSARRARDGQLELEERAENSLVAAGVRCLPRRCLSESSK